MSSPRQTASKSTVEAHFATVASEQPYASTSDRARDVYIRRQLVVEFQQRFGMSEAAARAEVDKEMSRQYKPNPWDTYVGRRPRPQRRTQVVESERVEERRPNPDTAAKDGIGYSDEQWDLFERQIGYR